LTVYYFQTTFRHPFRWSSPYCVHVKALSYSQ